MIPRGKVNVKLLIIGRLPEDFCYVEMNMKSISKRLWRLYKVKWLPKKPNIKGMRPLKAIGEIEKYAEKYFDAFAYVIRVERGKVIRPIPKKGLGTITWLNRNFEMFARVL